jgi:isoaspartyl peptidase/L-asparaginase-like protein (Ntn-hydrolase superfamily)
MQHQKQHTSSSALICAGLAAAAGLTGLGLAIYRNMFQSRNSSDALVKCSHLPFKHDADMKESVALHDSPLRCVAATWDFGQLAVQAAVQQSFNLAHCQRRDDSTLSNQHPSCPNSAAADAIEHGINCVEDDNTALYCVGYGSMPNADGIVECDAGFMCDDGNLGIIASVPNLRHPISLARCVMQHSKHTMLVGPGARAFASKHDFPVDDMLTTEADLRWKEWKQARLSTSDSEAKASVNWHDTVGVIALDHQGNMVVGCSTAGAAFKEAGRVGDSPLPGCAYYVLKSVGGAVATGSGDEMMKSSLCFDAVTFMAQGKSPFEACRLATNRLLKILNESTPAGQPLHRPSSSIIAMDYTGQVGAWTTIDETNVDGDDGQWDTFPYVVFSNEHGQEATITQRHVIYIKD